MPKFQGRECIGYKRVVQELQRWISRLDASAEFIGHQTQDSAVPEAILNQVAPGPKNVPQHGNTICGTNVVIHSGDVTSGATNQVIGSQSAKQIVNGTVTFHGLSL
jgi:hypothetical protein